MTKTEILILILTLAISTFSIWQLVDAYRNCQDGRIVRGVWHYECVR